MTSLSSMTMPSGCKLMPRNQRIPWEDSDPLEHAARGAFRRTLSGGSLEAVVARASPSVECSWQDASAAEDSTLEVSCLRSELEQEKRRLAQALKRTEEAELRSQDAQVAAAEAIQAAAAAREREEGWAAEIARLKEQLSASCTQLADAQAAAEAAAEVDAQRCHLARQRTLRAAESFTNTADADAARLFFFAWKSALVTQKVAATRQQRLLAEEASRGAALRAQKLELDSRYMEAEARHRSSVSLLRKEIADMESRHADTLSKQEESAARRLTAAERDFAAVVSEIRSSALPEQDAAAGSATSGASAASGGASQAASSGTAAGSSTENALQRAIDLLRQRADLAFVSSAGADADLAEALRVERERYERRLATAERHHAEALSAAREAGERRLQAAEARHAEALVELHVSAALAQAGGDSSS